MEEKNKIMTLVFIVSMLILVVSTTYAFFAPQAGGTTSTNAVVTSNTTDLLTFSINRDISFTVTQNDFQENGQNKSGDATATATLTPNNKTGAATMNYYLYLNLQSNPTVYSEANTNNDPELMLQVFDGSNQLVTLIGLGPQKTIKGVTGYDITGVQGLKTLLNNREISASNNTATIENWKVVITLINLDVNQNDNTGKTIEAEIEIQQDRLRLAFSGNGTIYRNNLRAAFNNHTVSDEQVLAWCFIMQNNTLYYDYPKASREVCEQVHECMQCEATVGIGQYETDLYDMINQNHNYLKHKVINNVVINTETCIFYNNQELCIAPNYWVETGNGGNDHKSIENGIATLNKLQNAVETTLGIRGDNCNSNEGHAACEFGDLGILALADGSVVTSESNWCGIDKDGSSDCAW